MKRGPTDVCCITGMHRSGTSLVAGIVNILGVDLGPPESMWEPDEANPRGYWEQAEIVDLNDEILAVLGGSWRDPPVLEEGWEASTRLEESRGRATALLGRLFGRADKACWKDPRTSLLLPFWRMVVPVTATILVYRDPREVAHSLARRDGIDPEQSAYLWLQYLASAWRNDPGTLRVNYAWFFEDLDRCLALISDHLGLGRPTSDIRAAADEFVDPALRRSKIGGDGGVPMRRALDLFEALEEETGVLGEIAKLDAQFPAGESGGAFLTKMRTV